MRILLADDHAITREGTRRLLETEADLEVIAEAADGEETVRLAQELRPDVVLLDISMPVMNGLDVVRILQATQPETRIVVLTGYDREHYVQGLLHLGIEGYLSKSASYREIVTALRTVGTGRRYIRRDTAAPLSPGSQASPESPTARELEILSLVARGYSNSAIADQLHLSQRTVKFHLRNLFAKLAVCSRTEMVYRARQKGWIQ